MTISVMVVEDENMLRFLACEALLDAGFDVLEAVNADQAIEELEQHPEVDILFSDIRMPGEMNGLELAAVVHARWPDIKLMLTSGDVRPSPYQIADHGKFIPKPYMLDQLPALLAELKA